MARGEVMRPSDWERLQIDWTWEGVAWILNHSERTRLERLISYARDVRGLAEKPIPPLVAWSIQQWLDKQAAPGEKKTRPIEL